MRLTPEQLNKSLEKSIIPVYLIAGDEFLLVNDCVTKIKIAADKQGFQEVKTFELSATFNWDTLYEEYESRDLLSEKKILYLPSTTTKLHKNGVAFLTHCLENANLNISLILQFPKLSSAEQKSMWVTLIEKVGVFIPIANISPLQFSQWLREEITKTQLLLDNTAFEVLIKYTEGNLLSARQACVKLQLQYQTSLITEEMLAEALSDDSRFDVFSWMDTVLKIDTTKALKQLHFLKMDNVELPIILWALAKDIRVLAQLSLGLSQKRSLDSLFQDYGVWKQRQSIFKKQIQQHSLKDFYLALNICAEIDVMIKGGAVGDPWKRIEDLILLLAKQ